jgi:hypothetical protein
MEYFVCVCVCVWIVMFIFLWAEDSKELCTSLMLSIFVLINLTRVHGSWITDSTTPESKNNL